MSEEYYQFEARPELLRPPTMSDHQFILECYADWPLSDRGPITPDMVTKWIRRWMYRDDELCRIWDDEGPKGLITWRQNHVAVKVDNVVVHPDFRGMGHGRNLMQALRMKLRQEAVVVAEFDAIPGIIADKVMSNQFEKVSEDTGKRTGLPILKGRITRETKL